MPKYWTLKTREDRERKIFIEHWDKFKDKSMNNGNTVIAIGWGMGPKGGKATLSEITDYMKKRFYPEPNVRAAKRAAIAAKTVWRFINEMNEGDEVLLCQGFSPNQNEGVKVHGIATIRGKYWEHKESDWFQRKRNADLVIKEKVVSKERLAKLLGKDSLLKTVHEIGAENFKRTKRWLIGREKLRNPNWHRDELILALDLYFRVSPLHTSEKNPEIVQLSKILNALPLHPKAERVKGFRNPNGVYMKLCNFLRLDPDYHGEGLDAGSKLDEEVWNEFYSNREQLSKIADAIRRNYSYLTTPEPKTGESENIDEDEEFPEGRILSRSHRFKERNFELVKKKKLQVFQKTGKLACEVCNFEFTEFYGDMGQGCAECHHNIPIAELQGEQGIKLSDLSILCPNCHRVIHRRRPWLMVQQLRDLLRKTGKIYV